MLLLEVSGQQKPELLLDMYRGPELHLVVFRLQESVPLLDVSTLQRPVLNLDEYKQQGPELHLDMSGHKEPVLLLDMSTPQRLDKIC